MPDSKNISTEMETAVNIKSTELNDTNALVSTFSVDSAGGSARSEEVEKEEDDDGAISVTGLNLS